MTVEEDVALTIETVGDGRAWLAIGSMSRRCGVGDPDVRSDGPGVSITACAVGCWTSPARRRASHAARPCVDRDDDAVSRASSARVDDARRAVPHRIRGEFAVAGCEAPVGPHPGVSGAWSTLTAANCFALRLRKSI